MKTLTLSFTALALSLAASTSATAGGFLGSLSFSDQEIADHYQAAPRIAEVAAECLQKDLKNHQEFYKKWRISPYYGDQSSFAKANSEGRRQYLKNLKMFNDEQISFLLKTLQPTSCIGLALRCMGQGFEAAGQQNVWKRLKEYTVLNDVTGDALLNGLQKLGWKINYWNPDTSRVAAWDAQERELYPNNPKHIWGEHAWNWQMVQKKRKYLYNTVDDIETLVNFGRQVPDAVKEVPFFVGLAHMGYHVFPGSYGQIIEGHSTRQLTDSQTLETSPFNPLQDGGGPRGNYYSGLIAIPPGYAR